MCTVLDVRSFKTKIYKMAESLYDNIDFDEDIYVDETLK